MYRVDGSIRPHYQPLSDWIAATPVDRIKQMREAAKNTPTSIPARARSC